jgi:hypothetical protein
MSLVCRDDSTDAADRDALFFANELRDFFSPEAFDAHGHVFSPALMGGAGGPMKHLDFARLVS